MSIKKDERNAKIFELFNQGKSERFIADEVGVSKTTVHKVLEPLINKKETAPAIKKEIAKLTGNEERFTNFSGWIRTNVNEYSHKDTGEVIKVAFVKAKSPDECGYFVKLNS